MREESYTKKHSSKWSTHRNFPAILSSFFHPSGGHGSGLAIVHSVGTKKDQRRISFFTEKKGQDLYRSSSSFNEPMMDTNNKKKILCVHDDSNIPQGMLRMLSDFKKFLDTAFVNPLPVAFQNN